MGIVFPPTKKKRFKVPKEKKRDEKHFLREGGKQASSLKKKTIIQRNRARGRRKSTDAFL